MSSSSLPVIAKGLRRLMKPRQTTSETSQAILDRSPPPPAPTLAGIELKVKVSDAQEHSDEELIVSIMDEIAAMGELAGDPATGVILAHVD